MPDAAISKERSGIPERSTEKGKRERGRATIYGCAA